MALSRGRAGRAGRASGYVSAEESVEGLEVAV